MLCLPAEKPWKVWLFVADGPEELVFVAAIERALPDEHFVKKNSKGPPFLYKKKRISICSL